MKAAVERKKGREQANLLHAISYQPGDELLRLERGRSSSSSSLSTRARGEADATSKAETTEKALPVFQTEPRKRRRRGKRELQLEDRRKEKDKKEEGRENSLVGNELLASERSNEENVFRAVRVS